MKLTKHCRDKFGESKIRDLNYQVDTFIIHIWCGDTTFSNLKGIGDLANHWLMQILCRAKMLCTCEVDVDFTCCYCNDRKTILIREPYQKWIT